MVQAGALHRRDIHASMSLTVFGAPDDNTLG